jgi:hypothetical protein
MPFAGLLNTSSYLATTLGVAKLITIIALILVTLCCSFKFDLDVQHARSQFVEQKFMLSYSFRCDQVYNNNCFDLGHAMLFFLSQTQMFNMPEASLLNKSSSLAAALNTTKLIIVTAMILVRLCFAS